MIEQLASIPDGEERLLIATGRYIGEGFDDARLDTLFLVLPVSWKGTLIQYTGRLHRLHPGKTEVRIYDYVDHAVPMLMKMFEKRLRGYRASATPGAAATRASGRPWSVACWARGCASARKVQMTSMVALAPGTGSVASLVSRVARRPPFT